MVARTVKGVRLTQEELDMVDHLLRRFPFYRNESNLLSEVCRGGLRDLALEAGAASTPPYAGVDAAILTDDVERAILLYIHFLTARGRQPPPLTTALPQGQPISEPDVSSARTVQATPIQIDINSADDVKGLSGGFLEDDEDC